MKGEPNIFRSNRHNGPSPAARRFFEILKPMLAAEGGAARIDYAMLSARMGISGASISKFLSELDQAGWIIKTCRGRYALADGAQKSLGAKTEGGRAVLSPASSPSVVPESFIRPIPKERLMAGRA